MLSHLIESGEVLNQQVFQDTAGVNLAGGRPLSIAICRVPLSVDLCTPHSLGVLEVGDLRAQDIQVPRLVDVELRGHERPESVIHPDAGNAVTVGNKTAVFAADNGRVGSVDADAAVICGNHLADALRLHEKQGKAVLPQIAPAASAAPVIVVGQEGTAEQTA